VQINYDENISKPLYENNAQKEKNPVASNLNKEIK
jgi:hypothetical protein